MAATYTLSPLGDQAVIVEFGKNVTEEIQQNIQSFCTYLMDHPIEGMIEFVPAFTNVTIFYDPWKVSEQGKKQPYETFSKRVSDRLNSLDFHQNIKRRIVDIPVCYGEDFGPDLEFVAKHNGMAEEDVIRIHSNGKYLVYMIGFAPGFPYLGGMSEKIAAPRKASPRKAIPAGSVGIAGAQTGIYPFETPGGWQLIGRTPLSLFQPDSTPPTLLQTGDIIRFAPISRAEFDRLKEGQS
ncbi:5-oxoprolinase subunit PxpB [Bacillus songklensis]|uniref:5-oxoprolinase subunit PxpB n=1 Tax=Bacillus songklensis TaxID=1069116 RepID=A0ABV8B3Y9_9BACI